MSATPEPFTLQVSEDAIADLRDRLARTRFPDQPQGEPWSTGTDVAWLRGLVRYWGEEFDWRAAEARLNAVPQYRVSLGGIGLHYILAEGNGPAPLPLLLSHGWPGSVFELLEIIPRLTDPARFGGDARDAFTVVAPSLPGYGLSFAPGQKRFSVEEMADLFHELMTGVLGFRRFGAQGGDWGSFVTGRLGYAHPESLAGIHLNMMPIRREPEAITDPTPDEARFANELKHWIREETGYQQIQGTKPQTLAFAMTDSPAGLAAWIAEKMRSWSDCGGDVERAFPKDEILANVSLYWFTGAIGSSFWPYYARLHGPWPIPGPVGVPAGYAAFPHEMLRPPRSLAAKAFTDLRHWSVMEHGGHFAAWEQPEALAADIAAFFRPLR